VTRVKLFKAVCKTMWGPRYRSEAARRLGISLRTMMRYDAGESPIPDDVLGRLFHLFDDHIGKHDELLQKLEEYIEEHIGWAAR
jgi:hypothetical protein